MPVEKNTGILLIGKGKINNMDETKLREIQNYLNSLKYSISDFSGYERTLTNTELQNTISSILNALLAKPEEKEQETIISLNRDCINCKGGLSVCPCRCHKEGTQSVGCDEKPEEKKWCGDCKGNYPKDHCCFNDKCSDCKPTEPNEEDKGKNCKHKFPTLEESLEKSGGINMSSECELCRKTYAKILRERPSEPSEGWEERFDKQFFLPERQPIKAFITQTIKETEERMIEKVKSQQRTPRCKHGRIYTVCCNKEADITSIHNQALEDVRNKIKGK